MSEAVVLQSGFLAIPGKDYLIGSPTEEGVVLFQEAKYDKHLPRHKFPQPYHSGITEIFNLYQSDELIINTFEFAERLYKELYEAFNGLGFYQWMALQRDGTINHMTRFHTDFLNQLIDYLQTGQWGIAPEVWVSMIYARKGTDLGKIKLDDLDAQATSRPIPSSVTDFIVSMMTHRTGLKNLLYVAALIFGEKDIPRLTGP